MFTQPVEKLHEWDGCYLGKVTEIVLPKLDHNSWNVVLTGQNAGFPHYPGDKHLGPLDQGRPTLNALWDPTQREGRCSTWRI